MIFLSKPTKAAAAASMMHNANAAGNSRNSQLVVSASQPLLRVGLDVLVVCVRALMEAPHPGPLPAGRGEGDLECLPRASGRGGPSPRPSPRRAGRGRSRVRTPGLWSGKPLTPALSPQGGARGI